MRQDPAAAMRSGRVTVVCRLRLIGISAPEYPQGQRNDDRDDDAGRDREVERVALALDAEVAGQVAEPQLRQQRPQQPEGDAQNTY